MRALALFELFLSVFAFYAVFKYEGDMRIVAPVLCLFTAFLFGRVRIRQKKKQDRERNLSHIPKDYKSIYTGQTQFLDPDKDR